MLVVLGEKKSFSLSVCLSFSLLFGAKIASDSTERILFRENWGDNDARHTFLHTFSE